MRQGAGMVAPAIGRSGRGATVRSDWGSNLATGVETQLAQSQTAALPAAGAQVQASPQPHIGPQVQTLSSGRQAQNWSQLQDLAWSLSVI